jgi:inner membrane protein
VFNFIVAKQTESGVQVGSFEKFSDRPDLNQIGNIWHRIWDPTVSLLPSRDENGCRDRT